MGRTALRRIIDHPDLELVGVHVYDERKVGLDAGKIARRPLTGVLATNSIESIVALKPDVVIHTPRISNPYAVQDQAVIELLRSGCNVISTAGFHFPDAHGAAYSAPLLDACRGGHSTLAGLGLNPGFVAERLAVLLTGMCSQLSSLATYEIADASSMPSPAFVFDTMGFGTDPQLTDITRGPLATLYGDLFLEVFHAVADMLGTQVTNVEPQHRLTLAPRDITIAAGTIKSGTVAATEWRWQAEFADKRHMIHSVTWTADPTLHGAGARDAASWRIEIKGRPNVHATLLIEDPDPGAPHTRAGADATIALALRAIPEVCAAAPGFFRLPTFAAYSDRLRAPSGARA
jgi:2,4-diaminopentanoate dehydrogenase